MKNRKITATYVALPEGFERNCIVTVDEFGVIKNIDKNVDNIDSISGLEYYNGVLSAGFINCHCHLEYSYVKGMIAKGGGLPKFISSIIDIKYNRPVEIEFKREMASKWDEIMYKNGITAVGDHNNNDYVTDIKQNSKIYYHTFIELYDADNQDAETTLYQGVRRAEEQRSLGLTTSVVPHATYTLSDDLVQLIGGSKSTSKGYRNGGILSTHFHESAELGGVNESERMISAIDTNHPSILFVHSIYAKKEDIEQAKAKYGDILTISPCPLSNLYIENRLPDYNMLIDSGVRIAIGTDGLSSNEKLSIVDEMSAIQRVYPNITMQQLVEWSTKNGAKALGIDSWAGAIEVGKNPGIILIENIDLQNLKFTDDASVLRLV